MDDFEHELARMLHQPQDPRPFEPRHRERLWAAVRARRRARMQRIATGSALAVAACAVGLVLLPRAVDASPGPAVGPAGVPGSSVPATPLPTTSLPQTPSATSGSASRSGSVSSVPDTSDTPTSPAIGMSGTATSSTYSPTGPTTTTTAAH